MPPEPSLFDLLDRRFRIICSGRRALTLPGPLLSGEHQGRAAVPLVEVREALLRRGTGYDTRNAVLAELVRRARGGEPWTTGLAGVLLFGLRAVVGPLTRAYPWWAADLESEALAGLFKAVRRVPLDRGRIAANLIWSARRGADLALNRELAATKRLVSLHSVAQARAVERLQRLDDEAGDVEADRIEEIEGPVVDGEDGVDPREPDAVLEEAFRARILRAVDVEVIKATRLTGVPTRQYAHDVGSSFDSARTRRYRAERRLTTWIAAQQKKRASGVSARAFPDAGRRGRSPERVNGQDAVCSLAPALAPRPDTPDTGTGRGPIR